MTKKSFGEIAKEIVTGKGEQQDSSIPTIGTKSVSESYVPKINTKPELSEIDKNKNK